MLVVVDNWSKEIDFEPLKTHKATTVLKAFQKLLIDHI